MNIQSRQPFWSGLLQAALVSALLVVPLISHEQTFFASGGSTNSATRTSNVALGYQALNSNNIGYDNTASGFQALLSNIYGFGNTANGSQALYSNTTGGANTANGSQALYSNNGSSNTATGYRALQLDTTGYYNTANGGLALQSNTTGNYNTANGCQALISNTTAFNNTATGYQALNSNTTGNYNTANGSYALFSNISGEQNIANGISALYSNTTGYYNIANGANTLSSNTSGSYNTASGDYALLNNTTGNNNVALGFGAGQKLTTGHNNIAIGNPGATGETGVIRLGTVGLQNSAYIAGINGVTANGGVPVYINANGQLGTIASSRRFKDAIQDMGNVSDKLMQLRPVTFRYKDTAEKGAHALQYGLIAEEVAKVYPDLVQYDKEGKPFTIYYHLLTPMLLNELQKAHHQSEDQRSEITTLKTALQKQNAELAALKQAQQQQLATLTKLTTLVAASQNKASAQKAVYMPR